MERNPFRHRPGDAARLRLEALEDRRLLAVAAFDFNLYRDDGGAPGASISDETLEVGQSFFVEITAQEFDPRLAGLRGVALDIAWDPAVLEEIDDPFTPSALITPQLPAFQSGTLDQQAGTIDNLAGGAFLASSTGGAIGDAGAERFALLHFRVLAAADGTSLTMSEGRSSIVSVPTATFVAEQLDFERQFITIVDPPESSAAVAPQLQINFYQVASGTSPARVSADEIDPQRSFAIEITVPNPRDVSAPARLDVASLKPFALGTVDLAAGDIWFAGLQIDAGNRVVEPPIAIGKFDDPVLPLAAARRVDLLYVPHAGQAAAVDAVMATTPVDALLPAVVHVDNALIQALACGLARAQNTHQVSDPFIAHLF